MKNREAFANDAQMYQKKFDRANVGCAVILAGSNDFALPVS